MKPPLSVLPSTAEPGGNGSASSVPVDTSRCLGAVSDICSMVALLSLLMGVPGFTSKSTWISVWSAGLG